jgi:hypothetical protein
MSMILCRLFGGLTVALCFAVSHSVVSADPGTVTVGESPLRPCLLTCDCTEVDPVPLPSATPSSCTSEVHINKSYCMFACKCVLITGETCVSRNQM